MRPHPPISFTKPSRRLSQHLVWGLFALLAALLSAKPAAANPYLTPLFNRQLLKLLAGNLATSLAGTGGFATFNFPSAAAIDSFGNVYTSDFNYCLVRKTTAAGRGLNFSRERNLRFRQRHRNCRQLQCPGRAGRGHFGQRLRRRHPQQSHPHDQHERSGLNLCRYRRRRLDQRCGHGS